MRHHFIFVYSCGCPRGLIEQVGGCRTEDDAWDLMCETRQDERAARAAGVTVKLVDHTTYIAEYYDRMRSGCPHRSAQ